MALFEMSPNIQESETTSRKRSHDEFAVDGVKVEGNQDDKPALVVKVQPTTDSCEPSLPPFV